MNGFPDAWMNTLMGGWISMTDKYKGWMDILMNGSARTVMERTQQMHRQAPASDMPNDDGAYEEIRALEQRRLTPLCRLKEKTQNSPVNKNHLKCTNLSKLLVRVRMSFTGTDSTEGISTIKPQMGIGWLVSMCARSSVMTFSGYTLVYR